MDLKKIIIICLVALLAAAPLLAGTVDIEQADEAQIKLIQTALGEEYPISKSAAVKSFNQANAYYVGAVFHVVGAGDLTGVWFMSGGKSTPHSAYPLDGNASYFSGTKQAGVTITNASKDDPEARVLKKHLDQ